MNFKIIFAIIVFVVAVIAAPVVGTNFTVSVSNIPESADGQYIINANCMNNGDGTFHITMNTATMNSPDWEVVMMHEIGHVNNWNGNEEDADNFANSQGVGYIHDATY